MGQLDANEGSAHFAGDPCVDVLVVEDDADVADEVVELLQEEGHRVTLARDGEHALRQLQHAAFDLVVSDVRLPGVDGLQVFRFVRDHFSSTAVILMSAYGTVPEAVDALRDNAAHYLRKPFEREHLVRAVREVAAQRALQRARRDRGDDWPASHAPTLVGECPAMRELQQRIAVMAQSDAPVLIRGDSGTGKELVARAIHAHSARRAKPFVAINCAAFPETLFEAELFGHERGAFTGADRKRDGRFQAARGGTLFLDEVSEMSPTAQAKLLRVLEQGTFQRLGDDRDVQTDVRIVSATNAHLRERMQQGTFRQDLYYRLKVLQLRLPPLRERKGDLALLVAHFLDLLTPRHAEPTQVLPAAWAALCAYDYPGNVRELAHALRHALVLSQGNPIDVVHLPEEIRGTVETTTADAPPSLREAVAEFERHYITQALASSAGNRTQTASALKISRKSLWERMKRYGIDPGEFERGPGAADADPDA
jgi:two-component system response regulator AtoC